MTKPSNYLVPNVIVKLRDGERGYDIYSRLLEDRIIFLGEDVNEHTANVVVAQLLHLANEDPTKDIQPTSIALAARCTTVSRSTTR